MTKAEIASLLQQQFERSLSATSVYRLLRINAYRKVKPTKKPGLTDKQKAARLVWCLDHQYWSLEDWKRVVWSDETSVVHGVKRGGERVWRTPFERSEATCRRSQWKGFSEFTF